MMNIKKRKNNYIFRSVFLLGLVVFFAFFVLASIPSWNSGSSETNYTTQEGSVYLHNFSMNITGFNNDVTFSINTNTPHLIYLTNSTGRVAVSQSFISPWISITNSTQGILKINATYDNQSGFYEIPIQASNSTTPGDAATTAFEFIINATNDAPNFTISSQYNTSTNQTASNSYNISLVGIDEDNHYPLIYNVSFNDCLVARWSPRNASANCTLQNSIISVSNTNSILSLANLTKDHVGIYNLTVCAQDIVNLSSLPLYRSADYAQNKSICKNTTLNIQYLYTINASSCDGLSKLDSQYLNCSINVTSKTSSDDFNFSSVASLNGASNSYVSVLSGRNWFYLSTINSTNNFLWTLDINKSLNKSYVGNWTINLSARSIVNSSDYYSTNINFFINRTANSFPNLSIDYLAGNSTSEGYVTIINLNVTDNDFLIPDKSVYNETVIVSPRIFNASNLSQEVFWPEFSNKTFSYQSGNLSMNSISFTPNSSQAGKWTMNFTFIDNSSEGSSQSFNLTILDNSAPIWAQQTYSFNCTVNSSIATTLACFNSINLSNYASDLEGDSLTFRLSGSNSTLNSSLVSGLGYYPGRMNFKSSGLINFTPWKQDVSENLTNKLWVFNITANDGYLDTNATFIFNITNINSEISIEGLSYPNVTSEGNNTIISFRVSDFDFLIPRGRIDPVIELSINNITPVSQNLNFSLSSLGYNAINNYYVYNSNFVPLKNNSGNYTINISASDGMNKDYEVFNMSVLVVNNPPAFDFVIPNFYEGVNRTFYYDINATDIEHGTDSSGEFIFNYTLISGAGFRTDRIFDVFLNNTEGVFNITFNDSHAGKYHVNMSINDGGFYGGDEKTVYQTFYLYVYGAPNITFPSENVVFSLIENNTFTFNFSANSSAGDNLTYEFWMDSISCPYLSIIGCNYSSLSYTNNITGFGNNVNNSWSFTPNFLSETYGLVKNLTVVVYSSNSNLSNSSLINSTRNVKLNISHTNHPLEFKADIGPQTAPNTQNIVLNMTDYFLDYDYLDSYYNQQVDFEFNSSSSPSFINQSFGEWSLDMRVFQNVLSTTETVNITAREYDNLWNAITNSSSNSFLVIFTEPVVQEVQTPQSSGGGSSTIIKRSSMKINLPQDMVIENKVFIDSSVEVENDGEVDLGDIMVEGKVYYNNTFISKIYLNPSRIASLTTSGISSKKKLPFNFSLENFKPGRYKISFYANSSSPVVFEENSFYLDLLVYSEALAKDQMFIFTEKLISENPQCLELNEILDDAKDLYLAGKTDEARLESEKIVDACKKAITKNEQFSLVNENLIRPIMVAAIGLFSVFMIFILFYIYKRVKFNKGKNHDYV
jgi:hypothetical protein